jgi:DNA-binding LacI/PurR family transcriptional regulator
LAGVSQSAVSRAFTPGASISPKARARVVEAAKALGYRPNSIARSLITQRSRLIGVAMAYMENQFYPAALEALSQALARAGYRVLLFTPAPDGDSDPILDEVLRYQVEAVVLASTSLTSHFAEECAQARVPVVMFNRRTERALASSITGDNVAGGREIAAFLAAGGHNRFAYVAGLPESSTSRDRELGYRGELERLGLALHDRVVGRYDLIAAREAARALFSAPEPPDAVFCANDHMAFAVMDVARLEFGLKIGRDVSIVGFDDTPLAAWPAFDLTTYAQSAQTMAQLTADAVLRLLEDPDREPIQQIVPGRLVVRGSARRPAEREWQD